MGRGGLEREEVRVSRRAGKKRRGRLGGLPGFGLTAQQQPPIPFLFSSKPLSNFRFKFECKFKFEITLK
jgi:hypothetical protein